MTPTPESQQAALKLLKVQHPKWGPDPDRGALEYALRDAYAAGCSAAQNRSLVTAQEYAKRVAPEVAAMLCTRAPVDVSHAALAEESIDLTAQLITDAMQGLADRLDPFNTDPRVETYIDEARTNYAGMRNRGFMAADRASKKEMIADIIKDALRAHPAGGVSNLDKQAATIMRIIRPYIQMGDVDTNMIKDALRAAGIGAGVVPEGWKLVRIMPDEETIAAAWQAVDSDRVSEVDVEKILRAGIAAATSHDKGQ